MKISWKSFFLSFGVALVVFAILMACICADIFRDFVPYPQRSEGESSLVKTRESYESYLFYCNDKEGASLEFAVLARVDQKEKCILVTELYGDDL
ncbi:MAG: hypothetical protein J6B12_00025, partial [Clostridia bacterium]|nr:hypothetical protein [Clostridia bacterium]